MKNLNKNLLGVFWIFENNVFFETQKLEDIKSINGFKDSDLSHYHIWDKVKNNTLNFIFMNMKTYQEANQFIIFCRWWTRWDSNPRYS